MVQYFFWNLRASILLEAPPILIPLLHLWVYYLIISLVWDGLGIAYPAPVQGLGLGDPQGPVQHYYFPAVELLHADLAGKAVVVTYQPQKKKRLLANSLLPSPPFYCTRREHRAKQSTCSKAASRFGLFRAGALLTTARDNEQGWSLVVQLLPACLDGVVQFCPPGATRGEEGPSNSSVRLFLRSGTSCWITFIRIEFGETCTPQKERAVADSL